MADTVLESSVDKAMAYATLLYPESCAENFISLLRSSGYPCLLSPLHDSDFEDDGETLKKPHYHLLIWFRSQKRKSQFEKLRVQLKGVGLECIDNPLGYARYLCHLDDPDKAQYPIGEVLSFGGLNYGSIMAKTCDKYVATLELVQIAKESKSIADMTSRVLEKCPQYIQILTQKSYFFINFIKEEKRLRYEGYVDRKKEVEFQDGQWRQDEWLESPFHNADNQ